MRHRAWTGTLNNYTDNELHNVSNLNDSLFRYYIVGKEVGEQLTPHLQAYFYFFNPLSRDGVKHRLACDRWHLEPARGTPWQNREYCSKEGNYVERGELPQQGSRTDLGKAIDTLKTTNSITCVAQEHPEIFVKYYRGLRELFTTCNTSRTWKTKVICLHGETGTGKTSAASLASSPYSTYWKMASNQWWDGYEGQEIVIIDDYRRDLCSFHYLLRLMDRYPLLVEVKGGTVQFLAKVIIITSPKSLLEVWTNRTDEELGQLRRRIDFEYEVQRNCGNDASRAALAAIVSLNLPLDLLHKLE